MKTLYTSPVITVEDLAKADVLCDSTEKFSKSMSFGSSKKDNINQMGKTLGDLSSLL